MLRRALALALGVIPVAAHADWHEASTQHFVVYSDQRPEKIREFAANLERFDIAVRKMGNWPDQPVAKPNRLTVYMVSSETAVGKLAGNDSVAGFYKPRAGGSFAIVPRSAGTGDKTDLDEESILLHEYTHHLMWSLTPNTVYPEWFVEGFAELFATVDFEKNGEVILGRPPQYRAYGLMSGNNLPIQRLIASDTLKLDARQRDALYGRGWLLTHYLMVARKRPGQLTSYLTALNKGTPSVEAAQAFGDLGALDKELERYKNGKLSAFAMSSADFAKVEVALRRLTPGEAATMTIRIRSKNGVTAKTAPEVYADAQKAAAPYPNDPGAQIVLAETAYDVGELAAAEAAADRAIAADPRATEAYRFKAMARMAMARRAKDRSKETQSAIRRIIAKGNATEHDDPNLLILYFRSFVDFGSPPSDSAKQGLIRAFEVAPQDRGLRFNTAALYLREGNTAMARAMLAPLAYSPHARGSANHAATLIATIDKGDVQGAIKALDGPQEEGDDDDTPPTPPAPAPGGSKSTGGH